MSKNKSDYALGVGHRFGTCFFGTCGLICIILNFIRKNKSLFCFNQKMTLNRPRFIIKIHFERWDVK